MIRLRTDIEAVVFGTHDAWSPVWHRGFAREGTRCRVLLEIQGDDDTGYNLVQSPCGFFTADSWHATLSEAKEAAAETFDVALDVWR